MLGVSVNVPSLHGRHWRSVVFVGSTDSFANMRVAHLIVVFDEVQEA